MKDEQAKVPQNIAWSYSTQNIILASVDNEIMAFDAAKKKIVQ